MDVNLTINAKIKKGDYYVGVAKLEYKGNSKVFREKFSDDSKLQEIKVLMLQLAIESIKKSVNLTVYVKGLSLSSEGKGQVKEVKEEIHNFAKEHNITIVQGDVTDKKVFYEVDNLLRRYLEDSGYISRIIYLDVPFDEKEIVKKRGARWDGYKKKWYCTSEKKDRFKRWLV